MLRIHRVRLPTFPIRRAPCSDVVIRDPPALALRRPQNGRSSSVKQCARRAAAHDFSRHSAPRPRRPAGRSPQGGSRGVRPFSDPVGAHGSGVGSAPSQDFLVGAEDVYRKLYDDWRQSGQTGQASPYAHRGIEVMHGSPDRSRCRTLECIPRNPLPKNGYRNWSLRTGFGVDRAQ